jgi:cystathionine beta-lyase
VVLEEWFLSISSPVKEDAIGFLEKIKLFTLAESLGGVEFGKYSVMMARIDSEDKRKEIGITDDLVRLSVGIEDADDLIDDLKSISINSSVSSSFFE